MAQNGGYTVGNLEVTIRGISSGAINSIDKVINKLNNLQGCLKGLELSKITGLSKNLSNLGTALGNVSKENLHNLTLLGTRIRTFGEKLNEIDWSMAQKGFANLTNSISPFLDKIIQAEKGLRELNITLNKVSSKRMSTFLQTGIDVPTEQAKKLKSQNRFFTFSHLFIAYRIARRLGSALGKIVQSGTDYTETLNLWSVAMRKNLNLADQFINKMNKAYGISEKTLMNAQAIFKNMIGSLGQISDDTAYQLSEAITQMAVDYSSLYNVQLKSAFSKFQAMLAGQVRPIRSVSGYDITETTLFQLYQSIGGTKTMRQLTRTEKQLLSIYAVFKQMSASGALGDMTKTLDQFANQSRMMAENFQRTGMWAGVILKHLLQESGIMVHINAMLIYFSEIFKAIALRIGATGDEDFFEPLYKGAEEATDAIEELKGTLLDFDEFRALDSNESNSLINIDKNLLNAIKGYSGIIDQANNSAQKLADTWLRALGFTKNANGEFEISANNIDKVIHRIKDGINILKTALVVLSAYWLTKFVPKLLGSLQLFLQSFTVVRGTLLNSATMIQTSFMPLWVGFSLLIYGIHTFLDSWKDLSVLERAIQIINALLAGLLGVLIAVKSFHLGVTGAVAVGSALVGTMLMLQSFITRPKRYANGGMPQAGTLFVAGEAGAEVVYNNENGQSGVANIAQLKSAFYQALVEYGTTYSSDDNIVVQIDGEKVFNVTRSRAKSQGLDFAKVGGR